MDVSEHTSIHEQFTSEFPPMAWGDLAPVPWVHLALSTERDPDAQNTWLTLGLTVDAITITNQHFPGDVPRFKRPGGRWGSRTAIGDKITKAFPPSSKLVTVAMRSMVLDMAFLVRECDPRIGTIILDREFLPRCPLFDPPRMRPPRWIWAPALDSVPCPFCQQPFESIAPAMWSGGNLLWTHPECWAQIHSKASSGVGETG